jgi:GNAT superfamily N-acetyltransferase
LSGDRRAEPGWTARYASEEDSLELARLHVASWQATYTGDLPADYLSGLDPAVRAEGWRSWFRNTPMRVLVVEEAARLVGLCAYGPGRDADLDSIRVLTIYNLHAAPGQLGRGIGRFLFERVVEEAIRSGYLELSLWVLPTNRRAREFYARLGLRPDGASQTVTLEPGAVFFEEIRYRAPLSRLVP